MLHGILRFDGHPSMMMGFLRNIEGIGPHISSVLEDWGTNPSDLKNELSLRTFLVMNETDGLGGVEGLAWIFSGLIFSSSSFSSVLSSWESLCCLGWIMMALIEPWTWVEHYGSIVGIMPLKRLKKKSIKRLVEKRVAKAIDEYEKTKANLDNAGSSGGENLESLGELATYNPRMEQELWTLTLKGDDIEAYNNHFHELALMCPDLVPNEKKKVERASMQFLVRLQGDVKSNKRSPCPPRCGNCHKLGHEEEDCRTRIPVARGNSLQNVTCFGCEEKGHYRDKCPRGRNPQNKGARGRAYLMRTEEPQQDPKLIGSAVVWVRVGVSGVFLLLVSPLANYTWDSLGLGMD
ncbi:putative reverse transcriptase domain-containing protein [Tanacetum coccineum]